MKLPSGKTQLFGTSNYLRFSFSRRVIGLEKISARSD